MAGALPKLGEGWAGIAAEDDGSSSTAEMDELLFIAQIAASVRLWTRILRRIVLTCTFTVASAMFMSCVIILFESPRMGQRRIDCWRADNRGVCTLVAADRSAHAARLATSWPYSLLSLSYASS